MIRRDDALVALRMLGAGYPAYPVDADTVELYVVKMTELDDLPTLYAALDEWITNEDRFPTVHQVLSAYRVEAQRRVKARREAEQARAERHGILAGMPAPSAEYAAEMVDVLRTVWEDRPQRNHTHRPGVDPRETCLTCANADQIAAVTEHQVRELCKVRGITPPRWGQVTYACIECMDRGWVLVGDVELGDPRVAVHPCPACQRDTHARWEGGHYGPGHSCSECDDARRGKYPQPA